MIKVLTLSSLFPDSSRPVFGPFVERQTLGIAAHPGVDLRVVAPLGIPPWPVGLHSRYKEMRALALEENWKGLTVYRPRFLHLPATGGRYEAAMMVRALKPLLANIRESFAFDLIDAEFFFPDGPAATELGRHFGVPVSVKARGADIHYWGTKAGTGPQVVKAGQEASGLLAVSAAIKHDMVTLGISGDKIRVHYTGVDLTRFQPLKRDSAKADLGVSGPLIACVGALIPRKGQSILIEALSDVPGATLVIIGKGEDDPMLKARAQECGVAQRCIFTGSQPQDKIAQWLGAAEIMALPTASEGLANVWVEALACGTPVITCNVGGAAEIIDSPAAGLLVERTPHAFAEAIAHQLAKSPDPDATRACAERFTWDRNTETLFEHFSHLCAV